MIPMLMLMMKLPDRVMNFWSLEKSLDQWYRSKVTYNVASYHMLKKVELALTPNIKVEVDTSNLIVQLVNLSSHKIEQVMALESWLSN